MSDDAAPTARAYPAMLAEFLGLRRRDAAVVVFALPAAVATISLAVDRLELATIIMRAVSVWREFTRLAWEELGPLLARAFHIRFSAEAYDLLTLAVLSAMPIALATLMGRRESYFALLDRSAKFPWHIGVWGLVIMPAIMIAPTAIIVGGLPPVAIGLGLLAFVATAPFIAFGMLSLTALISLWRPGYDFSSSLFVRWLGSARFWAILAFTSGALAMAAAIQASDTLSSSADTELVDPVLSRSDVALPVATIFMAGNLLHWRMWPYIIANVIVLMMLNWLTLRVEPIARLLEAIVTRAGG